MTKSSPRAVIVYYPPGQRHENDYEMIQYLSNGLDIILTKWISSGIIIAGDFNMLNISRVCSRFGLRKTVSAPTRGKNTLDQIATNMFNLFDSASCLPLLVDQTTSVFSLNQKII